MKHPTISDAMAKGLKRLIWVGAAAAWVVAGFYVYKFVYSTGEWFTLSSVKADWGTFGDYFGGVLNPFFSYLAFMGVLITVALQARQLDMAKAHAGLEEMQRVQATMYERIERTLASNFRPPGDPSDWEAFEVAQSLFATISALGTHMLVMPEESDQQGLMNWRRLDEHLTTRKEALGVQAVGLIVDLESLAWMLAKYREAGGNETVLEFYRYRFTAVTVWMDALGLLSSCHQAQAFFEPKENRAAMVPEQGYGAAVEK